MAEQSRAEQSRAEQRRAEDEGKGRILLVSYSSPSLPIPSHATQRKKKKGRVSKAGNTYPTPTKPQTKPNEEEANAVFQPETCAQRPEADHVRARSRSHETPHYHLEENS